MGVKYTIGFLGILLTASCNHEDDKIISTTDSSVQQLKVDVGRYPDSLQLLEKLIQYYRDSGSYDTAIAITDNAIKRDSQVAELWDIKATLHYENEDTLNSIKAFERAINVYPLPEYLISLGTLYAQTKNPPFRRIKSHEKAGKVAGVPGFGRGRDAGAIAGNVSIR